MQTHRSGPVRPLGRLHRTVGAALGALLAAGMVLGGLGAASADELDDRRAAAEAAQRQKQKERAELEHQLEDTDAKFRQAVLDLNEVEGRLPVAQAELAEAQAALEEARRKAAILAQRLEDAQAEEAAVTRQIREDEGKVEAARADIVQMARQAYRAGDDASTLGIVTGAQSTQEFLEDFAVTSSAARSQARTLSELQDAEAVRRNQQARLDAIRETIAGLKAEADANVVAAEKAEKQAEDRKAEVERLIAEQKALKASIEKRRAAAIAHLDANREEQAALEAQIKDIIVKQKERDARLAEQRRRAEERAAAAARAAEAEARRKAAAQGGGGSTSGGSRSGGGGARSQAPFLGWPTNYRVVTSSYGMRYHPTLQVWRLHAGTDIRTYCGTPIYAAQSGYVEQAYYGSGPGNNVLINHGTHNGSNVMTRYLHLSRDVVGVGRYVSKGQVIGYSGSTGTSAACHLHFEVYVDGSTVDPMRGWLD